jgi:hypothetical protein
MTDNFYQKEAGRLVKALPIYLAVQVMTLLITYLEFPVYMEAYQAHQMMTVSGWVGIWFALVTFGAATGLTLLINKTWKSIFSERERSKLVTGYFLGVTAGLLALGLRFMPVMPVLYFYIVGGVILLLVLACILWSRRQSQLDEIFP